MSLEELRKKFIVDEDFLKARLEALVERALTHCKIDKTGQVLITNRGLSNKDQVTLILAARALAHELDSSIPQDVTAPQIGRDTGLAPNQVRARANEVIASKFAESPKAGLYRAVPHKIEEFLERISTTRKPKG
jgi:hypothetical protein